jgi:histidine ammonia-lyase
MAPLLKVSDALVGEIIHGAAPAALGARASAHEVEDASTGAPLAAGRLAGLIERLRLHSALELVVAAQAVDLAQVETLGRGTGAAYAVVRELAAPLERDRPLGADVERVAAGLDRVVEASRARA